MSCSNPRYILNPVNVFDRHTSKVGMSVPCGKCESCKDMQKDNWYMRSISHMEWYRNNGGRVYFLTITYNKKNLPHYVDKQAHFKTDCFSYQDVSDFIHAVRDKYRKVFRNKKPVLPINPPVGYRPDFNKAPQAIDFLLTSEFGEKKGRPHYHLLLFVPRRFWIKKGMKVEFTEAQCYAEVREIVKQSWNVNDPTHDKVKKRGFVMESKEGLEVVRENAHNYVTKYICKDIEFEDRSGFTDYLYAEPEHTEARKKMSAHFRPRHFQSNHFGEGMVNWILESNDPFKAMYDGKLMRVLFCDRPQLIPHAIPQYVRDKVIYGVDGGKNGSRVMTDFGLEYSRYKAKEDLKKVENNLRHNTTFIGLSRLVSDNDVKSLQERGIIFDENIQTVSELYNWFQSQDIDYKKLSLYALFLRHRLCNEKYFTLINNSNYVDCDFLTELCNDLFEKSLSHQQNAQRLYLTQNRKEYHYLNSLKLKLDSPGYVPDDPNTRYLYKSRIPIDLKGLHGRSISQLHKRGIYCYNDLLDRLDELDNYYTRYVYNWNMYKENHINDVPRYDGWCSTTMFYDLPQFQNYERILSLLDNVVLYYNEQRNIARLNKTHQNNKSYLYKFA